ncbi:alkaline phosphatase [Isoptericola aurantiacus]|uniref:alkaline phosphatase n=1 Tax=Isoptericola aurantiacus TaxID=3377839 RepID=UPI00383B85E0
MRKNARRLTVASALVGTLVLGGATSYAVSTELTGHGDARRLDGDQTRELRRQIDGGDAQNVILLIGDGMGDSEITLARNYAYGAAGELPGIDALPLTGQYTTYALDPSNGKPDYVTDSAASGSGWATGTKTYNGAISVDVDGASQETLLELAQAKGLRTGNVTTAEIQDATPAVQMSHVAQRGCKSPSRMGACPDEALENGGAGSITEQALATRPDVVLGGGASYFGDTATAGEYAGQTLMAQAQDQGFEIVTDAAALDAVRSADQDAPVLGLFADGNLPTVWDGPAATHAGGAEEPVTCTDNPAHTDDVPTLEAMTTKAIDLLDAGSDRRSKHGRGWGWGWGHSTKDDGFFLQVEGASIDKQDHAANPCAQIGETVDFDAAVEAALDFAAKDGNTLVIVSADHAHSSQIVYPGSTTPGLTRTLMTADGQPMTVAYGTAEEGGSQAHTGSQVRVAGYGPGAANVVGLTDQTDVFFTVRDALNL